MPFKKNASISGNAIFIIMLAVVLLGALTTAVIRSGRSPSFKQKETIQLQATKIVKYGTDLQMGADFLMSQGVDPYDIDFIAPDAGAFNTAPNNKKMFHPEGAGIVYQENELSGMSDYVYSKVAHMSGHGANAPGDADDVMFGAQVTRDICMEINNSLYGFTAVPYTSTVILTEFLAGNASDMGCLDAGSENCSGRVNMCITDMEDGIAAGPNRGDAFYAGWIFNGKPLQMPGSLTWPQTQKAYSAPDLGDEIYVYFHVLVTQ